MKSSGNSSAKATLDSASRPSRRAFALTGPSIRIDPRVDAVRGDLADVRLADRVFAPHYAAPMPAIAIRAVSVFSDRNLVDPVAALAVGESFDVLELAGNHAWGIVTGTGPVGYVDRTALDRAALPDAPPEADAA